MKVTTHSEAEARRLELEYDNCTRTGNHKVTAPFSDVSELIADDKVSIRRVILYRNNSDDESRLIDEYVMAGVPDAYRHGVVKQVQFYQRRHEIRTDEKDILKASVDKLKVHRLFETVLVEQEILAQHQYDTETFADARDALLRELDNEIAERKEKKEEIQDATLDQYKL